MSGSSIYLMIIGISLVSILPRILPVALFSRFEFPDILERWLSFVAPSVLGALMAVSVLAPEGKIFISFNNLYIWAFIPTLLVAVRTRSLFYTLLTGIIFMAILHNFIMM